MCTADRVRREGSADVGKESEAIYGGQWRHV